MNTYRILSWLSYPVGYFIGATPALLLVQWLALPNSIGVFVIIFGAMIGILIGSIGNGYFSRAAKVSS